MAESLHGVGVARRTLTPAQGGPASWTAPLAGAAAHVGQGASPVPTRYKNNLEVAKYRVRQLQRELYSGDAASVASALGRLGDTVRKELFEQRTFDRDGLRLLCLSYLENMGEAWGKDDDEVGCLAEISSRARIGDAYAWMITVASRCIEEFVTTKSPPPTEDAAWEATRIIGSAFKGLSLGSANLSDFTRVVKQAFESAFPGKDPRDTPLLPTAGIPRFLFLSCPGSEKIKTKSDPGASRSDLLVQLEFSGPYMKKDVESRPDPRVPFTPDTWQIRLLDAIDRRQSALVVAPTSSGKTFAAYYVMEKVIRHHYQDNGCIVYVSPTKALVNQVAAEVQARYELGDALGSRPLVGVFTRDYRTNERDCRVLVTVPQILENLLMHPEYGKSWNQKIKASKRLGTAAGSPCFAVPFPTIWCP